MMNGKEFAALRKAAGKYTNGIDESDDMILTGRIYSIRQVLFPVTM